MRVRRAACVLYACSLIPIPELIPDSRRKRGLRPPGGTASECGRRIIETHYLEQPRDACARQVSDNKSYKIYKE